MPVSVLVYYRDADGRADELGRALSRVRRRAGMLPPGSKLGACGRRAEKLEGLIAGADAVKLPLQKMEINAVEVQTVDQNIRKLESDRIDCLIEDRPVIYQALKNVFGSDTGKLDQFQFMEKGFGDATEYKLLVSMKYPDARELLEKFNAGLKKIKASGEYQKILKRHGQ